MRIIQLQELQSTSTVVMLSRAADESRVARRYQTEVNRPRVTHNRLIICAHVHLHALTFVCNRWNLGLCMHET